MAYKHLSSEERFYIEQRLAEGERIPAIAKALCRHKTTLYRELKRNTDPSVGFYSYLCARNRVSVRKTSTLRKVPKLSQFDPAARQLMCHAFSERMSPEQVAKLLRNECQTAVSHQTLYRHIRCDRVQGGVLYQQLRRRGKAYRKNAVTQAIIKEKVNIATRPPADVLRREAGHYEIDTIFGLDQQSFLLTLVDIATRYTLIVRLLNKEAQTVCEAIKNMMASTLLPFKSITSDNGSEFARHRVIAQEAGIDWYFCDPYSSWQRGLNENTNGLIRDFYPKRTDFRLISDAEILAVQNLLNNRPRKALNFMTPTREMVNHLMNGRVEG